MTAKIEKPSRLRREMIELAGEMRANGTLDNATFGKITMRNLEGAEAATLTTLTGDEIRKLRENAHMSQAVFAQVLNVTVGYVSKLERGTTRAVGAALKLLTVIQSKGIEVVL